MKFQEYQEFQDKWDPWDQASDVQDQDQDQDSELQDRDQDFKNWVSRRLETKTQVSRTPTLTATRASLLVCTTAL